jgi:hypothetical protein
MRSIHRAAARATAALVTTLAISIGTGTVAVADTMKIDFEGYDLGSIDGQDGWGGSGGAAINPAYDQEVVADPWVEKFDAFAFRLSNAVTSGSFGDWPFSPSLADEAGETSAQGGTFSGGARQTHFEAKVSIASALPDEHQEGLQISFAPDRGDGARMSFVKVRDTAGGLDVDFADYRSGVNETGCATGSNFVTSTVATNLDRTTKHSIRLAIDFIDGPANDVVAVYVDRSLVHVGTTWEDYFRECESNPTRTVDSLLFQARTQPGQSTTEWAANDGNGFLIDNIRLTSEPSALFPCAVDVSGSSPTVYRLLADCVTDHTIIVPQHAGGTVFDGDGHSITGVDPAGGHFIGAVLQADAGNHEIVVRNVHVTVSGLNDVCDPGDDRLRGILFDGVGGAVRNTEVTDLSQGNGTSGCQEGNAIEVRNAPFDDSGTDVEVAITGNVVTDYQKTGILANGSVAATIRNNVATGFGPVTFIAQNGIQVGFGATAFVRGNVVSGNYYTPPDTISCGLLIFQADGVKKQDNDLFENEKNLCNFGRGGGSVPIH